MNIAMDPDDIIRDITIIHKDDCPDDIVDYLDSFVEWEGNNLTLYSFSDVLAAQYYAYYDTNPETGDMDLIEGVEQPVTDHITNFLKEYNLDGDKTYFVNIDTENNS